MPQDGPAVRPSPVAVVVVPAHDEAAVVGACLEALLAEAAPGELAVVVVANGCRDDTAARARATASRLSQPVHVLELPTAGKAAALRAADRRVREVLGDGAAAVPRVYLDADVVCRTATVRELVAALQRPGVALAVPTRELDLSGAGLGARLHYRTWSRLPRVQDMLAGRGCYALSASGRAAVGPVPDGIADDRFVTTALPRSAARVVRAPVRVRPPGDLRSVLAVRTRVRAGNVQLGSPPHPEPRPAPRRVLAALAPPQRWPGAAVYAAVTVVARARARTALRRGTVPWGRDVTRGALGAPTQQDRRSGGPDRTGQPSGGHR